MFNQERYEVVHDEVDKPLKAGFIREVNYLKFFNVVIVKKLMENERCIQILLASIKLILKIVFLS